MPVRAGRRNPLLADMLRIFRTFYANPYALLALTMLFWAGNALASRMSPGHVSPMVLTALRWGIAALIVWIVMRREICAAWPVMKANRLFFLAMGTFGMSLFSLLLYASGHFTTAINIALLQGAIPIFTLIGAFLAFGTPILGVQVLGIMLTIAGVALTASEGRLAVLAAFAFNAGDLLLLAASLFYAGYTVALRKRPPLPALVFYAGVAAAAALTSLPLLAAEIALGKAVWPDAKGLAILAFVAICPSFLAQIFYIRAVEMIGPGRAVLFANLTPVLGALLAVLLLGEVFGWHHAGALVLVLGGIWIAETGRRPDGTAVDKR